MSLRFRRLELRVQTANGLYGVDIPFENGLVVLRADNTTGKSTCVQAIIYALGLERMLGPSNDIPLPHVMTRYVEDGAEEINVLESEVLLEIANASGDVMALQRSVINPNRDRRLIRTWAGAKLSDPQGSFAQADYFVRDPGAATHEAGFHSRLAEFLGWKLPTVGRFQGGDCPLYMEAIFPLFMVEQKHGWSGIQGNLPNFLGIRDMARRAIEFTLDLDAARAAEELRLLERREAENRAQWSNAVVAITSRLRSINARIAGVPVQPTSQWPPAVEPQIEVYRGGEWIGISAARLADKQLLASDEEDQIPTVGDSAEELSRQLAEARQQLSDASVIATEILDDLESERLQMSSVEDRLKALQEDLQRNQDAAKLTRYGSISSLELAGHRCPTCHQGLADTLLPQTPAERPMSVEDNIEFIKNQMKLFARLRGSSEAVIAQKEAELASARSELDGIRSEIRALRETLTMSNSAPSLEAIRQRYEIETRLDNFKKAQEVVSAELQTFETLAEQWRQLQEQRRSDQGGNISAADEQKLARLEALLQEHLTQFGFISITPRSVTISRETFRPSREGFNLGFDLSASDGIRLVWAYVQGLLELSAEFRTNHPGFLIFDEPRQQEAAELSFAELIRRAANSKLRNDQVIFATSEPLVDLQRMTAGLDITILSFDGRLIRKLR